MSEGVTNGQILQAILDLKQSMGSVQADARNANEHAASVSKKADRIEKKIDEHVSDDGAHGAKARGTVWSSLAGWAALALGGVEAFMTWKKH